LLTLATLVSIGNNYTTIDNAYYKAYFIKVVEVAVLDVIFYIHVNVSYKLKLHIYKVRVFIEGLLKVIYTHYIYLKFKVALYKAVCLLGANRLYAIHYKERIRYIFYTTNLK